MTELDGSVWVSNYVDGNIARIDGATNAVVQTVAVGGQPCGITATNGKLWVAALLEHSIVEVDPATGSIARTVDAGDPPWDLQFGFGSIWAPVQGTDVVLRIDPADGTVLARIPAGPVVSGLAITANEVWVANQGGTTIDRIDPTTNKVAGHIDLPDAPFWFAVGDTNVIVTLSTIDSVVLINAATGKAGQPITVGMRPRDPGFVGGRFWVPNQFTNDVSVVDPASGTVTGSFSPPGASAVFLADEALGDGWILDYGGTTAYRMNDLTR